MLFKDKKWINTRKHGLAFLNITQFSVVLVDNIFKLIIAFFLIDLYGASSASQVLSVVGAVYVLPFLLLSSIGGSLADRFSKRNITIFIKCMGGGIILAALFIFYIKSAFGCYVLLFLLSTQSALFGPSKYGMIPELVPVSEISKANGYITSFTYFAIILGTFLGSFLSQLFDKNYFHVLLVVLVFSSIGIIASFLIPKVFVERFKAPLNFAIIKETISVIKSYPKKSHLGVSILANSFFLLVGAFTQLAIIPFAIEVLKKTEFIGGYLFLTTALGIALGSQVVAKLSKGKPVLVFPAIGGVLIALMLLCIGFFGTSMKSDIVFLVILGIAGGFYIVPLDAFVQITATAEQRGRVLGANNFLGFTGVLCASLLLYLMNHVTGLKPDQSFVCMGLLSTFFMYYYIRKISDRLLGYFVSSKLFKKSTVTILPKDLKVLVVPNFSFLILSSIFIEKDRLILFSKERKRKSLSCFINPTKKELIKDLIENQIDPQTLILIKKNDLDFDPKELNEKIGFLS